MQPAVDEPRPVRQKRRLAVDQPAGRPASDLRRVDTTRYRYFFDTQVAGAEQGDALELHVVQVTCTRG